ncbi:MAG: UDP-N-acetylmuramate dehydrogenase [Bacteroidetes bacterium]|nr:UDP-N-acetylmuramate dehydrogenase [Bacteroidota bacterium]
MISRNVNLKAYNTFGMNVTASYFAVFRSVDEITAILHSPEIKNLPLLILGGGSNLLLTKDFDGLVLKNELSGIVPVKTDADTVYVKSAAGEVWHNFVLFTIENNLGGVENLSLIPGSVGAAPMQNIGAYGTEIKDTFYELEAYEIATGQIKTFGLNDCKFGYRESVFKQELKNRYIIISVTFRLTKNPVLNTAYGAINDELQKQGISQPTIRDVSNAVIAIRSSKLPDPKEIGNSGSFFKNPVVLKSHFEKLKQTYADMPSYPVDAEHVKLAAGWLIEKAGWKGKTLGNYGVHKNQALVLVNYGGASGSQIFQLSEDILQSVKSLFDVTLEREVNIL